MPNDALTLAKAMHQRTHSATLPTNPTLLTVFALIDHYVGLHLSERDRLIGEIGKLRSDLHRLAAQGDSA